MAWPKVYGVDEIIQSNAQIHKRQIKVAEEVGTRSPLTVFEGEAIVVEA